VPVDFDQLAERITPEQLAEAVGAERTRDGLRCPGPEHDDRNPSFSVFRDNGNGRTAARCHGCDLRGSPVAVAAQVWGVDMQAAAERLAAHIGMSTNGRAPRRLVAEYPYRDEEGRHLFTVCRFEPKDFRQRAASGAWTTRDVRRVLYRLPETLAAIRDGRTVYVVEGEKSADRLAAGGLAATCSPGGAGKWRDEYGAALEGARRVVIVPDNDGPGRRHAATVTASLAARADVRVLELPDLADKADVFDWLGGSGTVEELDRLASDAPTATEWLDSSEAVEADEVEAVPTFATLRSLMDRPELLAPPEAVVPRLAYRGRATLFAGGDKAGKSTLWAHAAAALTRGDPWLDGRCEPGRVVWVGLEEAVGDAVRRFSELEADPDRVQLVLLGTSDLLDRLGELLEEWSADLVVVDSLAEYARVTGGAAPDDGDAAGWGSVIRPVVALSRKHDCAVTVLHHVRRSDGQYRSSSEIAAAVDALFEMGLAAKTDPPTVRRIKGRARWQVDPFAVRLDDGEYRLGAGEPMTVEDRVLLFVTSRPSGASKREIREGVTGRARSIDEAIGAMVSDGRLTTTPEGRYTARIAVPF
jgi:hypothetical protein